MRGKLLAIALIPLLLWGCTAATPTTGSEFMASVVPRIQRGTTTAAQIMGWLGEPYEKKSVSASEAIWLYNWSRPAANPNVVPWGHRNVGNTGYKKTLWLLIKNDFIVNYTYEEGII